MPPWSAAAQDLLYPRPTDMVNDFRRSQLSWASLGSSPGCNDVQVPMVVYVATLLYRTYYVWVLQRPPFDSPCYSASELGIYFSFGTNYHAIIIH